MLISPHSSRSAVVIALVALACLGVVLQNRVVSHYVDAMTGKEVAGGDEVKR